MLEFSLNFYPEVFIRILCFIAILIESVSGYSQIKGNNMNSFVNFNFKKPLLNAILEAGFEAPSPIQELVIPVILSGSDVVAQAQTGTGKTAAFGLPSLNLIDQREGVSMLVITPTRELAQQVSDELYRFGSHLGLKTVTVYGGQSMSRQLDLIRRGSQIVVATPGRLLDLLQSQKLGDFKPSIVVLDEADEMLDMGFLDDIQSIFNFLPKKRQTLLFSATMPVPIQNLAKKILKDPVFLKATQNETTNQDIKQLYCVIKEHERDDAIVRLIDSHNPTKSIIFCKTKKDVDRLSQLLIEQGRSAKGLHGDMEQPQRQKVIHAFREGEIQALVATDVAARGLNIVDVSHVFNYQAPYEAESYVHRIGRTGRAGRKGVAITLLTLKEIKGLQMVLKRHGTQMEYSPIPSLSNIKKARVSQLVDKICQQKLSDEANHLIKILQEEMDLNQIGLKLISMLIENQNIEGPDRIGIDMHEVESFLAKGPVKNKKEGFGHKRGRPAFNKDKPFRKRSSRPPRFKGD